MTRIATLKNRITGKSTWIRLTIVNGFARCTSDAYNRALNKLGHGPLEVSESFLVFTKTGRQYAAVEA